MPNIEITQGIIDSYNAKRPPLIRDYLSPTQKGETLKKDLNLEDFFAKFSINNTRGFNLTYNNLHEEVFKKIYAESDGSFSRRIFMHMAAVMNALSNSPVHDAAVVVVQK